MNAFERFNIRSLSPTMIAQWDAAPATLILRRLYGIKGKANEKMWRGDAVEAGLQFWLHNRTREDSMANAKLLATDTFWQRAEGEISDEIEAAAAMVPAMVEQAVMAASDKTVPLMGTQFGVEAFLDDVDVPVYGKIDFLFEDKSIIELKTTTRCPSKLENVSMSHRWQAAFYAKARGVPVNLVYVTDKKSATFEVLPDDPSLILFRRAALSLQKALAKTEDGEQLLRSLSLNVESFYWDDEMRVAYEDALEGKLKLLVGPGTEDLAAQGYVTFGKHSGKHISELPDSYLNWLMNPKLSDGGFFDVPKQLQVAIADMREAA
ncbi:PD-(D/E)XK nuclease family protein [Rhizobium sp. AG207R]|uniref:PD-(D/E)XK nuclease family protein n=1 Tax=Rhizobium sp. AG207R TaxID=2802287 RepID=UPI0022ABD110|nr:PD-(D/E)XK nuclease family protein [Rhizobium sp. AG207R]MCZ3377470.1 PD-(D/E)XK nuclease family protein [Rhizobium sp. AG207R]